MGKSTSVNHLAYCLAHHGETRRDELLDQLTDLSDDRKKLLPVPVALREVAVWLQENWTTKRKAGLLIEYLEYWLS